MIYFITGTWHHLVVAMETSLPWGIVKQRLKESCQFEDWICKILIFPDNLNHPSGFVAEEGQLSERQIRS